MRRALGTLGALIAMTAITVTLLEVTLRVAHGLGILALTERRETHSAFYRDQDPRFGVWHPPQATFRATRSCFDVEYRTNSWGARDRERTVDSERPRVVVLGDSFVEGTGVARERRMTDLLEEQTGIEHLNFGIGGNFSSVQEWLLYESLARRFDHDLVLLFTLPDNDFLENDPERWWQPDRYRPYLRRSGEGFEVFYPFPFDEMNQRLVAQQRWNRLYNASFFVRMLDWAGQQVRVRRALDAGEFGHVGYASFDELDLERLFFSYRKLRDAAEGRPLVVLTIPRLNDLLHLEKYGDTKGLAGRLERFAAEEPGIDYADLAPSFLAHAKRYGHELADYFHSCDGHWSALGHATAAEIVIDAVDLPAAVTW